MAKCWFCKTKKAKRYCSPIENLLCPICCGENRLKKVDCNRDCRYLEGVAFQKMRDEEREFSRLMETVPHGQYDDIFRDKAVALIAFDIETLIRDIYVTGDICITDKAVFESYKHVYKNYFTNQPPDEQQIDELEMELLAMYENNIKKWESNLDRNKIGQVFLRLMISIKKMSGGQMGEFGYLNYLKNNLGNMANAVHTGQFIVEDKFGNKMSKQL